MPTFCSAYSETGRSSPSSVIGTVGIGHAPVVGAGGGEHQPLHPGLVASATSARVACTLTSSETAGSQRARGIADDRGEVHDGLGAGERAPARLGVADVGADHLDAGALLLGGDVLLAVQQRVQDAHLAPGAAQLRTSIAPM